MEAATALLRAALQRGLPSPSEHGGAARCRLLGELARDGLATLPAPGAGATLERWRLLACVAGFDLALVKLFEGHADALAILREAGVDDAERDATWGMWAAEAPGARVVFHDHGDGHGACTLDGLKAWCSGAEHLDRALLTVWSANGDGPFLASVSLRDPGVAVRDGAWKADGMAAADTVDVHFVHVAARLIGGKRFYLERPGFWQGGAGIAACWHGGATAISDALRARAHAASEVDWHLARALGEVDRVLSANAALLREAAAWIDAHPAADAQALATRVRVNADLAARRVIDEVGQALGAGPLCRDAALARMATDLPVFIRQCHGDRDLASLGRIVAREEQAAWTL